MLIAFSIIVVIFLLRFVLPAGTPSIRVKDANKSIAILEKINLGGNNQWILERSENIDNPIILFLHGGPGTSQLTSNRRNTKDLEKSFIVVNWDQRGAGKSYSAIKDSGKMNIDQFVEDTRELTLLLLKKFNKDRIILVGHSWGSVIGALAASRYPELYHCYIGIGQVANMDEGESASYEWALQQALAKNDKQAITKLQKIGHPPYQGNWQIKMMTERRFVQRYGGEVNGNKNGAFGLVMGNLLFSREYTLIDRINFFRGIFGSIKFCWQELLKIDLFKSTPEFKIPIYFMEGRFDHEVPSEIAEKYFRFVSAQSKELIWFEKSAHMVNSEEKDKFNRIMVERILPTIRK